MTEPANPLPPSGAVPSPLRRTFPALALLLAINLFNYIDRQVLAAVEPEIERYLFPHGPKDEAGFYMGLLSSAFLVCYMLTAPLFGALANRFPRWWIVGVGVAIWSLASGGSGLHWTVSLASAYWMLFLTRCLVGVGEGAYGPVAPAMISDMYPEKIRGKMMSWFYAAIPVGSALGYTLGGQVKSSPEWGWRWAFFLVVPPGLLLALLCWFMKDPRRAAARDALADPPRATRWRDYFFLLRTPSYVFNTAGMTAMTFALGGLAFWIPKYLEHREALGQQTGMAAPFLGLDIKGVTLFGPVVVVAGLIATLSGGYLGDLLRPRFAGSYFLVSGVGMILGFPLILLVIYTPFPTAWYFLFGAVFCLFFNTGPTNTVLANVTHPSLRPAGFALNILIIHALGDVISPPIIGFIQGRTSLDVAFAVVSLTILLGGILWLLGMKHLAADSANAPHALPRAS